MKIVPWKFVLAAAKSPEYGVARSTLAVRTTLQIFGEKASSVAFAEGRG